MIFLKSGILTSVQDFGRKGFQAIGLNESGSMDTLSMRLLNTLLANKEQEAVLEFHFPPPTIRFEEHAIFAVGGADFSPNLNRKNISNWKMHMANPGDMLCFGKKNSGERAYLAVKGGFKIEEFFGSKSTNLIANFGGKKINKGDQLELNLRNGHLFEASQKVTLAPKIVSSSLRPPFESKQEIRIIAGKELEGLDQASREIIFSQRFIISGHSDRMGYRLEGNSLNLEKGSEQISSSVAFGTIQLLNNGQLVILMADHQTTGGYPKIGNVIVVDLPLLAQLSVGQHITFREISVETAEHVFQKQERELKKFRTAVHFYS